MKLGGGGTTIEVAPFGAMLASARFDLGDGFVAEPFFMNPWSNDKREIEPFLRNLGAEWACVPFGRAGAASDLPDKWHINQDIKDWNHFIHGYGSNNVWSLEQIDAGSLVARIDYPEDTPIKSLERTIAIDPYGALNFSLIIEARWDARVGIGLHPVFDLTDAAPGSCALTVKGRDTAWSFPIDVEPGRGAFAPDQRNVPLSKMDGVSGGLVDGTQLPLDGRTEDLVLLTDPGGEISLTRKDRGYRVSVHWDVADLPCCTLWYSNGGREYRPWDGRVRAIGIEPTVAAFDLGQAHSLSNETPLSEAGIPTSICLSADAPWETAYSIRVERLD